MLIYLLLALTLIQLIRMCWMKALDIEAFFRYLIPYWEEGDGEDRLLGILQIFFIICISLLKAIKMDSLKEAVLIFVFTFFSFIWFIKLLVGIIKWLQEYLKLITTDIIFTLLVPVLIFSNSHELQGMIESRACLMALVLSLCIVYMSLLHITLQPLSGVGKNRTLRLKSIFVWLVIILINLYTLVVFIQFYWNGENDHFIEAASLNKETAIDLGYYLVVTFTTVGLGDIQPHTQAAKLVTILIALSGMFFTGIFVSVVLSADEKNKKE